MGGNTPPPFSLSCLADHLTQLTKQHCTVVAPGYSLVLLLSSTPIVALPYLEAPFAYTPPTRPARRPLSQRSILLVIRFRIFLDVRKPHLFIRTTWTNTRGISAFQLLLRTPCHYADSIYVSRRLEDLSYQLANCTDSQSQRCCQTASYGNPL